jgi:hypothetical protein
VYPGVNLTLLTGTAAGELIRVAMSGSGDAMAVEDLSSTDVQRFAPLTQTLEGDDVVDSSGPVPGTVQLIVQ